MNTEETKKTLLSEVEALNNYIHRPTYNLGVALTMIDAIKLLANDLLNAPIPGDGTKGDKNHD